MSSGPNSDKLKIRVSVASLLAAAFVMQLALPIVLFSSTALGAMCWVVMSAVFFLMPCLMLDGKVPPLHIAVVIAFLFMPPALFIGAANLANAKSDGRDIADLARTVYFMLAFLAGVKLGGDRELLERFFSRAIKWSCALILVYLVASFALRDFVDNLELFYGKFDNAVGGRLFAPFPNPYDLALFCSIPVFYFIFQKRWTLAFLMLAALVATQSRTGLLLLMFGFVFCFLTSSVTRRRMLAFLLPLVAVTAMVILYFIDLEDLKSTYLIANTIGLFEGQSTTLSRRFAQWAYVMDLPWLGRGTVRSTDLVIENAVIYELYRTGLLGLYSLFCFYVLPFALALRILWSRDKTHLSITLAIFVALTVIGFNSSVFIYQPKMSLMYWLAIGVLFAHVFNRRDPVLAAQPVPGAAA